MPNVVGLGLEDARTRLAADGFEVGEVTTVERDDVAENTVTASDPPAETPGAADHQGQPDGGRTPPSVQVPGEVVGMSEIEARGLLEAAPYEFVVTTAVKTARRFRRER